MPPPEIVWAYCILYVVAEVVDGESKTAKHAGVTWPVATVV